MADRAAANWTPVTETPWPKEIVSKATGDQISRVVDDSFPFPREAYSRLFPEPESRNIPVKTLLPHLFAHLRCSDVTGEFDNLLKGEVPVLGVVVDRSVINLIGAVLTKKESEGRTTCSSRAAAARKALNIEPGSKTSERARFLQLLDRYWIN